MVLSDQSIGALMMCLQKSLYEQSDIVPVLRELNFVHGKDNTLEVTNPPVFEINEGLAEEGS
tara:strand:+ start:6395 stop:6580 length:186 start_codon:yes stop_codon:yes gene_type:complete